MWWLRLPGPALSLLSILLIAAAEPKYARRLRFAAVFVFPAAIVSFALGALAWGRPGHEDAVGLWMWSAIQFAIGIGVVAWVARASTRDIERRDPSHDQRNDALPP